jgi:hypothetical protein
MLGGRCQDLLQNQAMASMLAALPYFQHVFLATATHCASSPVAYRAGPVPTAGFRNSANAPGIGGILEVHVPRPKACSCVPSHCTLFRRRKRTGRIALAPRRAKVPAR